MRPYIPSPLCPTHLFAGKDTAAKRLTYILRPHVTRPHQQLFNAVWGRAFGDPQQYLRVHVANLRRKIEQDAVRPQLIVTEPGVGYRFEMPR